MVASAKARHIRMSARKVRLVTQLVKGKSTQNALAVLANTKKKAALVLDKLLRSAIANAKNKGVEEEGLYISRIFTNEGVTWKRFRANAFGRGSRILKRTCHISVELERKIIVPKPVEKVKKKTVVKKTKTVTKK
ncbi:MAG: 50S ribosomal protein L22 [PVC group bacterium]|nr:50S ribosomal protein L22 [PVC group bacterium]